MEKFKLSAFIKIRQLSDRAIQNLEAPHNNNNYVLSSRLLKRVYLINSSIKYLLEKFNSPKSIQEVVNEVCEELEGNHEAVKKQVKELVKIVYKKRFLVDADFVESIDHIKPKFNVGEKIDDYLITKVLSNKRLVDIYSVWDHSFENQLVIKLLNADKSGSKKQYLKELKHFKHEYKLLNKGKKVQQLYNCQQFVEEDDNYAYMVLEQVIGLGIPKFLKEREYLDVFSEYHLIHNILKAFSELHSADIVHGDVHPSNIMVQKDLNVKIIDLGMALDIQNDKNEVVKMGGVLYYMPPERINNTSINKFSEKPDFTSDVYQLGLIIFYILFKTEPFNGFIWEQLAQNIKQSPLIVPTETKWGRPTLEIFTRLISKCTSKDPSNRFYTAKELFIDFLANTKLYYSNLKQFDYAESK